MKTSIKTAFAALTLAAAFAAAPVSAQTAYNQLAASAGLSQSEAAGMTQAQIAAAFFNRGESIADRQPVPAAMSQDMSLSSRNEPAPRLRAFVAVQDNRGESIADRQPVTTPTPGAGGDRMQLAAAAGLGLDGAEGRTLTEISTAFFNRGVSYADRQPVAN